MNRWQRFWWAFGRAWTYASRRGTVSQMTRQLERAFDRETALEFARWMNNHWRLH